MNKRKYNKNDNCLMDNKQIIINQIVDNYQMVDR